MQRIFRIVINFIRYKIFILCNNLLNLFDFKDYSNSQKIFCIGNNKTGTTSMKSIFKALGLKMGYQRKAELFLSDWAKKDYAKLINFVKCEGEAFQDVPFSLPETYKILDKAFPNSKFILTIRDSPEIWYNSLVKFHSKLFGNGEVPNKENLQNAYYVYKGWLWQLNRLLYNTSENDIYNKDVLVDSYISHNEEVISYFCDKPNRLLVINLKEKNATEKINKFLNLKKSIDSIPWKNKTNKL